MRPLRPTLMLIALMSALPVTAYAIDQEMYNSVHGDIPAVQTGSASTSAPETGGAGSVTTDAGAGLTHKKQVPATTTPSNVSAVDLDSDLSTSTAPMGGTNKMPVGSGVIARMPGAEGR